MKKQTIKDITILIVLFFLLFMCLTSCGPIDTTSTMGHTLQGSHQISKLQVEAGDQSVKTNKFFAIKKNGNINTIVFSWQLADSSFIISELPLDKVRFKYNEFAEQPSIKFRWTGGQTKDLAEIFRIDIVYAIVECKESDFDFKI